MKTRVLKIVGAVVGGLLVLVATAVGALATQSRTVDGHSMEPTLRNGTRFLVAPGSGQEVHRFDVVVFTESARNTTIVKRVIGMPGDRVEIRSAPDDGYQVLLQEGGSGPWQRVRVPAWSGQDAFGGACCRDDGSGAVEPRAQTVPAGRFFYLGDNPDGSADSRKFGWGEVAKVIGRVSAHTWPPTLSWGIGGEPTLEAIPAPVS
ncbi:signal peptidase I [Catenulispora subtropica]|uniref:Signal peptidase I n=1 Tax=Catenulispora subtropica TaxID=450798 RepID=A0ABN2RHS4_9ACTN